MLDRRLTVYRSDRPEVLQHWHKAAEAREAWGEQMKAFLDEQGLGKRTVWTLDITGYIRGIEHDGGDVPDGWRVDGRTGRLVPRLSTRAGKAIAAALDKLRQPDPRAGLPGGMPGGMPGECIAGSALLTCGLELMQGALYVKWSRPIPAERIDLDVWQPVKLSEYYALVELSERPGRPTCCRCDPATCASDETGDHCATAGCAYCMNGCPAADGVPCCKEAADA